MIDVNQCIICLENYIENDVIRILDCAHCFHKNCSDEWLYLNNRCPICNQNISSAINVHSYNNNNNDDDKKEKNKKIEIEMVEMNHAQSIDMIELQSFDEIDC